MREEKLFAWAGAVIAVHFRNLKQPCRSASLLPTEDLGYGKLTAVALFSPFPSLVGVDLCSCVLASKVFLSNAILKDTPLCR